MPPSAADDSRRAQIWRHGRCGTDAGCVTSSRSSSWCFSSRALRACWLVGRTTGVRRSRSLRLRCSSQPAPAARAAAPPGRCARGAQAVVRRALLSGDRCRDRRCRDPAALSAAGRTSLRRRPYTQGETHVGPRPSRKGHRCRSRLLRIDDGPAPGRVRRVRDGRAHRHRRRQARGFGARPQPVSSDRGLRDDRRRRHDHRRGRRLRRDRELRRRRDHRRACPASPA